MYAAASMVRPTRRVNAYCILETASEASEMERPGETCLASLTVQTCARLVRRLCGLAPPSISGPGPHLRVASSTIPHEQVNYCHSNSLYHSGIVGLPSALRLALAEWLTASILNTMNGTFSKPLHSNSIVRSQHRKTQNYSKSTTFGAGTR